MTVRVGGTRFVIAILLSCAALEAIYFTMRLSRVGDGTCWRNVVSSLRGVAEVIYHVIERNVVFVITWLFAEVIYHVTLWIATPSLAMTEMFLPATSHNDGTW